MAGADRAIEIDISNSTGDNNQGITTMGILKKSFGWIFNAYERPVDSIDIEEIEIKLDAIEKLRPALERMVKAVDRSREEG